MRFSEDCRPIELILPADANLMLVIRLTAAGVIARAGITVDRMDALKMAVEEACGCLMDQPNPPRRLRLRFACERGSLLIHADALDCENPCGQTDENELEVMRCILEALVDSAQLEVRDGWIAAVRMKAALAR